MRYVHYDLIICGTGPAGAFYLKKVLEKACPGFRILVLERGPARDWETQIKERRNGSEESERLFDNTNPDKKWPFTVGLGGSSNCWHANTPRMLPNDFRTRTLYGRGEDWPVAYDDLEGHYCEAERIMSVSGPEDGGPQPRSRPFPQPPHRFSVPDGVLKAAYPDTFFQMPTARARVATKRRPGCCANAVCRLCPINAKFSVLNEMMPLFEDPRVTLLTDAPVVRIEISGSIVSGVTYRHGGREVLAKADLVALATNAMFNAHLLLSSGITGGKAGRFLNEQFSRLVQVDLDRMDAFQGSTIVTGISYLFYDGPHRRSAPGFLIEVDNRPAIRPERGKWAQRLNLRVVYEDLPLEENHVRLGRKDPSRPEVVFKGHSSWLGESERTLDRQIQQFLAPLPVKAVRIGSVNTTDSHIQGTCRMGTDPSASVVDDRLLHHRFRNLAVLGSSSFPTCPPANPTLTLAALSLRAADLHF